MPKRPYLAENFDQSWYSRQFEQFLEVRRTTVTPPIGLEFPSWTSSSVLPENGSERTGMFCFCFIGTFSLFQKCELRFAWKSGKSALTRVQQKRALDSPAYGESSDWSKWPQKCRDHAVGGLAKRLNQLIRRAAKCGAASGTGSIMLYRGPGYHRVRAVKTSNVTEKLSKTFVTSIIFCTRIQSRSTRTRLFSFFSFFLEIN